MAAKHARSVQRGADSDGACVEIELIAEVG